LPCLALLGGGREIFVLLELTPFLRQIKVPFAPIDDHVTLAFVLDNNNNSSNNSNNNNNNNNNNITASTTKDKQATVDRRHDTKCRSTR